MKNLILFSLLFIPLSFQGFAQVESESPLFLYHIKLTDEYNAPEKFNDDVNSILNSHAEFLDSLGREGILVFAGRTSYNPGDENLFGIALIIAGSLEEAKEILSNDPVVKNKIMKSDVFPFSMGIRYMENLLKK